MNLLFVCMAVCGVFFAILAWMRPLFAAGLIIVLLPAYQYRFTVGPIPVTLLELMLVLFVGAVCVREWKQVYTLLQKPPLIPALLVLVFLGMATLSLWWTPELTAGLGIWKAYILEPVAFAIALYCMLNRKSDVALLLACAWVLVIGVSIVALVQFVTGLGIPEPWNLWPDRRAVGVFTYPNAVGLLLAPITMTAIAWLIHSRQWLSSWKLQPAQQTQLQWLARAAAALGVCAVLSARADGAVVAVVATTAFLLLFTRFRYYTIAVCAVGLVLCLSIPQTRDILLFRDVSGDVRIALWTGTINLIQHQPWTGAGIAAFPQVYDQYRLPSHVELLQYPHNILLDFWVEFGILGPIWLIAFFILTFKCLLSKLQRSYKATLLTAAPLLSTLIYGLVDSPYFKNDLSVLFWFWIALSYFILWDSIKTAQKNEVK